MKNEITIDVAGFKKVLDMMKGTVLPKVALPILSSVRLDWNKEKDEFTLTGSNGDSTLVVICAEQRCNDEGQTVLEPCVHMLSADAKEGWAPICVNYQQLRDIFSLLPAARRCTVKIEDKRGGHLMTIDYQDGQMELPYDLADDFPMPVDVITTSTPKYVEQKARLDKAKEENNEKEVADILAEMICKPVCRFTIGADTLLSTLREARYCTAGDDLRPAMEAVCIDVFTDHMVVVATDGRMLYKNHFDTGMGWLDYQTFGAGQSASLLLPKQSLSTVAAAFSQAENITVTADSQRIRLHTTGVELTVRTIEGRYPNYEAAIPKDNPYCVCIDRQTLRMALRRIQLSAESSQNMAVLKADGASFIVEAADLDYGRNGSERVPMQQNDAFLPDGFKIGVKLSVMLDLLDLLDEPNICLFFSGPQRPILMKNEGAKLTKTLLQMPMMVS